MKLYLLILAVVFLVPLAGAWQSVAKFEAEAADRLSDGQRLVESAFTNRLHEALDESSNAALRVEASLVLSIVCHQQFLDTADGRFLQTECLAASNAVVEASSLTNDWRYWCADFLYAGSCASLDAYGQSYCILTNGIRGMENAGFTGTTNRLCAAILWKFELDGLNLHQAFQTMAGMSAAELGLRESALGYARQLPTKFKTILEEFVAAKCPATE